MRDYRCFFLDSAKHYRDVEVLRGADDGDAIAKAQQLMVERDFFSSFEVWEGARLLASGRRGDLGQDG